MLPFSISSLGRRPKLELSELQVVLNVLPQAALLVDLSSRRLLLSNAKANETFQLEPDALTSIPLDRLFPSWAEKGNEKLEFIEFRGLNGRSGYARVTVSPLNSGSSRALVTIEELDDIDSPTSENERLNKFWDNLYNLANAAYNAELETALHLALEAGRDLLGVNILAVYRADESQPGLELCASIGPVEFFPRYLPPQDLTSLRRPHLWQQDMRTLSSLHRTARMNRLSFLATAPLGHSKAAVGLVAISDLEKPPFKDILSLTRGLAGTLTIILQNHMKIRSLGDQLQVSASRLAIHDAFESRVQEGLIVLSKSLSTLRINRAAETMLGYSNDEVLGQPIDRILIASQSILPALQQVHAEEKSLTVDDARVFRRSGEEFLAQIQIVPIMQDDKLSRIVIIIRDLSEQEQIREHAQQLEQRATLGEVTAVFAHEVRNPINNISTGLQLMTMNLPEDDPSQKTIERLMQDCDRLEELMKSVLSFAKPTEYVMEPVDLGLMLSRLLDRYHQRIQRANVDYKLQVDEGVPTIMGNQKALEQVFSNFITNAVQAMAENGGHLALKVQVLHPEDPHRPGGKVTQSLERRPYVEVSVADNGPGIPQENLDRIFMPFFSTKGGAGSGLGLAIAKRIVTAHRGTIKVTSFPGGTVFQVRLPVPDRELKSMNEA